MTPWEILKDMGWFENRRVDTTLVRKHLTEMGYSWFPKVEAILSEFGGLSSEKLHFNAVRAEMQVDPSWILDDYANRLNKTKLCILGQAFNYHLTLFMTDSGEIFGGFDGSMLHSR